MLQRQHVALLDQLEVSLVCEFQRKDPEVDEVLPMYPGKVLDHDDAQTQIPRCDRGVFAARPLPVVSSPHDGVTSARRTRSLRIGAIDLHESEFGDLGDVAAE